MVLSLQVQVLPNHAALLARSTEPKVRPSDDCSLLLIAATSLTGRLPSRARDEPSLPS